MAGMLITAGEKALENHLRVTGFFSRCKGLRESHREISGSICISKLSRKSDHSVSHACIGDQCIWVMGSLVYRNFMGAAALARFQEDLQTGALEHIVNRCDGQFCLVIKEKDENGFQVVTDHAGIMNLYKYQSGSMLAISSSSMALSRKYPVTVNPDALAQFLRTGNVYGSATVYNEISVLEPATVYRFEITPDGITECRKRYWHSPEKIEDRMTFEDAREVVTARLLEGIARLPREGLICDLTAGYDSRLLVSLLSKFMDYPHIDTFVFGPPGSREVDLVGGYCRALGMAHNHLALPDDWHEKLPGYVERALYLTDGEENVLVYAPILCAQEYKAKAHLFSMNGLGGELYRDFWWMQEIYPSKRPANLDRLIVTRVLQYEYDNTLFSEPWARRMANVGNIIGKVFKRSISDMDPGKSPNTLQLDSIYLGQKVRRWAGRTISTSNQVIGTLTPLTMKRCLEAVLAVPPAYKRNGRLVKGVIEHLSLPLSGLEMLNGAPCQNISLGNAHRFFPLILDYGRRGARKLVQKSLGRTILMDRSVSYQQAAFLASLFRQEAFRKDFRYDALVTQKLYDRSRYLSFCEEAAGDGFLFSHQLGNLLSLEMRMRNDNVRGDIH